MYCEASPHSTTSDNIGTIFNAHINQLIYVPQNLVTYICYKNTNSVVSVRKANYTDRVIAACWRS
jgi:hypothetical protein